MKPLELENSILSQAGAIDKNQTKEGTGTVPVNSNNSAAAPTELWQAIRTIIALQNQAPPLEPMQRQANLPLSFSQERLWLLNQLQPESSAHHIPIGLRIKGALNVPALEQSLNEIIRRHETLRTTFETIQGQPVQLIAPYQTLTLDLLDLRLLSSQERESETLRLAREQTMRPFDLKAGPLLRASLLQLDEQEYVLLLTLHQVIFDGWSQGVLFQELAALYDALSAGLPSPLSELPIQYADFALWQRHSLQGEFLQALLSYWQQQLGEGLAVQHLPTDRQLPLVPSRRSACQTLVLPQSLTEALKSFSRQEGVTLFATLLAAFKVLLHRYTQQDDLFVCTPTANRTRSQTKGLIGYFVNLLILRTDLSGNPSFRQLLARVRSCASAAFAHQDLPVQQLINALNLVNMPLSQVMFTLQNLPKQPLKLAGLSVEPLTLDNGMADFDLSVSLVETATEITGVWKYNTDLFEDATISQMLAHFHSLLETLVANPEQQLLSLPLYRENVNFQTLGTLNSEGSKPERAFVAPRTPTEEALADIWAEVFGLEQVGVHDDFFSLGGHSMLAIQLLSRMRDAFQLDLPSRYLFQSPTVAGLAECIEELQTKTLPSQAEQQSESSVVIIQPGGSKKPFFFIPGAGGNEIEFVVYANLGRYMNPEQPVYGLKARSFDAEGNPYTKLEALAVDYVKEIRAAQPDGPYFLGGECVGGVLAFEIAQQLLAEGQKVALLVLMDATKPNNAAYLIYRVDRFLKRNVFSRTKTISHLFTRINHHINQLPQLKSGELLNYVFAKRKKAEEIFVDLLNPQAKRSLEGKRRVASVDHQPPVARPIESAQIDSPKTQSNGRPQTNLERGELLLRYKPQPYPGRITLLINEELNNQHYSQDSQPAWTFLYRDDPTLGWGDIAAQGVDIHVVPGNHISYIRKHVQSAAKTLSVCLDKAQAESL